MADSEQGSFDLEEFQLTSFPVSISYFDPSGFFAFGEIEPAWHDYSNLDDDGDSEFIMVNAAAGWRLPGQRGVLSIEAQNLLDQDFGFQDRRPSRDIFATPRFAPDLTVMAKALIRF